MGYRLENKEVNLSGIRKLTFVPTTKAGDVYRYKNMALRIFKDGEKVIDQPTAKYLTDISTERILLPKKLLFYNNAFKGYTMKLVSQKGSGKKLITTPTSDLISCIEVLERDIETLSQKRVLLNDINPGYTLYNGELFLVNPANYSTLELGDTEILEQLNEFQLHLLLTELFAGELRKERMPGSAINELKTLLSLKENEEKSSTYLKGIMQGEPNVKELVKKIR